MQLDRRHGPCTPYRSTSCWPANLDAVAVSKQQRGVRGHALHELVELRRLAHSACSRKRDDPAPGGGRRSTCALELRVPSHERHVAPHTHAASITCLPRVNRGGIRDSKDDNVAYGEVTSHTGTGTGPYRC